MTSYSAYDAIHGELTHLGLSIVIVYKEVVLHHLPFSLRRHIHGGLTNLGLSTAVVDTEAVLLELVLSS